MKSKLDMEHFAAVVERYTTPLLEDSISNEEEGYEMSTKHTPGPWHIGARYGDLKTEVLSSTHRAIATVWTHAYNPADDKHRSTTAHPQGQANLALIAAAPALRTACEDVRAWGIELASLLPDERESRFRQLWPKINDVLRDAIAEAEPSPPIRARGGISLKGAKNHDRP